MTMQLLAAYMAGQHKPQCENLFVLVAAFIGVCRDMGYKLKSTLGCACVARDDDKLVGLEQSYQAQFVDTIQQSSEWQLDDDFLAEVWAPSAGNELLSSVAKSEPSVGEGGGDAATTLC